MGKAHFLFWRVARRLSPRYHTEQCQVCGRHQPIAWWAPQDVWDSVMPTHSGILCPRCMDRLYERAHPADHLRWVPLPQDHPGLAPMFGTWSVTWETAPAEHVGPDSYLTDTVQQARIEVDWLQGHGYGGVHIWHLGDAWRLVESADDWPRLVKGEIDGG